MTLEELIAALEAANPDLRLPLGFSHPHSYRGDYMDLAFEPTANVTVGEMLADARSALGTTYQGWKGGDFEMRGWTSCWLADEVFVVNPGGYIGSSTANEIAYATKCGTPVRYLVEES